MYHAGRNRIALTKTDIVRRFLTTSKGFAFDLAYNEIYMYTHTHTHTHTHTLQPTLLEFFHSSFRTESLWPCLSHLLSLPLFPSLSERSSSTGLYRRSLIRSHINTYTPLLLTQTHTDTYTPNRRLGVQREIVCVWVRCSKEVRSWDLEINHASF